MSLRERLSVMDEARQHPGAPGAPGLAAAAYQELKKSMHQTILDRIDLERLKRLTPQQFKHELALLVQRIIEDERPFIRCKGYVGPCRRRRTPKDYAGPFRRAGDKVGAPR